MAPPLVSRVIRYGTFAAAAGGVWLMSSVLRTIHADDRPTLPPPPVAPPPKPPETRVAATGIIEAISA